MLCLYIKCMCVCIYIKKYKWYEYNYINVNIFKLYTVCLRLYIHNKYTQHTYICTNRYPLKPRIFASLLETKGYTEHTDPDHPESIFGLNHWFKMTTVLFCALHSPVTYIYICNHVLNWNVFKNRYFSTLTLHCWFAQQSRISLTREK